MDDSKKKWLSIGAVVLVLIIGGTVWAVMSRDTGPSAAQVEQMGKDLFEKMGSEEAKNMSREERRAMWEDYAKKRDQLPFAERKKLEEKQAERWMKPINEYYALQSKEEQTSFIDSKLDEMDKRRQEREAKMAERGPRQPRGDNPQAGGDPNAAAGSGDAQNGRRGAQQQNAPEQDKRRRERLDMSSPEDRAKRADYRLTLKERAQERGMPPPTFGPGGRGGPPGGGSPRGGGGQGNTPPAGSK